MFGFIARVLGTMLGSVCLSIIPMLFMGFSSRRRGGLFRRLMRGSYRLYASFLTWLRPYILQGIGIDLLEPIPRTLMTGSLSFGIVWGVSLLFHLRLGFWLAAFGIAHGLFVGTQWERIILPQDFQMGGRIE